MASLINLMYHVTCIQIIQHIYCFDHIICPIHPMLRADTSIFYDDNLSLQHNIIWYIWKKTQASIAWPFPTREAWHFCVDLTKNGKDVQVMMAWPSLFVRINDCPWTPKPWEMKVSILKKYGLCPLKMRVLGSHGMIYIYILIYSEHITSDSSGMSVCLTKQKILGVTKKLLQSLRWRAKVVACSREKNTTESKSSQDKN